MEESLNAILSICLSVMSQTVGSLAIESGGGESLRTVLLALLQGLTEFLPVSSSAHLILPSQLLGWPDQGLTFDVAVHLGSLSAVLFYFRGELRRLLRGGARGARQGRWNEELNMLACLAVATLPVAVAGALLHSWVEGNMRSLPVIAGATIGFGLLLGVADRLRGGRDVSIRAALWIGLAQMLALVPGTSRSGITMTAGLVCGLSRQRAAQFSFLLSIPVILAAALFKLTALFQVAAAQPTAQPGAEPIPPGADIGAAVDWGQLLLGMGLSGVTAFLAIAWFLRWVERVGFMPFVIYRCLLGLFLFYVWAG